MLRSLLTVRLLKAGGTLIAAVVMLLGSALPAWAAQAITLTWVRHAQSTANAAGIIDTTVPGPGLTALGQTQANAIAQTLRGNGYDGIYVSDMVRTQFTAAPLAADLGITPVVLPGLQEVNAGVFEGHSGVIAGLGYALPPVAWVLGARFVPVLGGENGNQFEARVNSAVSTIYATGETNPIIVSHGATIMAWTLMNVDNPDLLLAVTHPLGNTAVVVVNGDPQDGWTLQSWDGVAVDPNPSLLTRLFVAVRSVVVAPQTALYGALHPAPPAAAPSAPAAPSAQAAPRGAAVAPLLRSSTATSVTARTSVRADSKRSVPAASGAPRSERSAAATRTRSAA